jgi:hypothetical protein
LVDNSGIFLLLFVPQPNFMKYLVVRTTATSIVIAIFPAQHHQINRPINPTCESYGGKQVFIIEHPVLPRERRRFRIEETHDLFLRHLLATAGCGLMLFYDLISQATQGQSQHGIASRTNL